MVSKVQTEESDYLDPLDEKTPTSVYMPQFASGMQVRASPKDSLAAQGGTGSIMDLAGARCRADSDEPSVIIASEAIIDYGCDGVADTVAAVRRQRWSAFSLALIAGLSGLFAVSLGILLADLDQGRCNMRGNEDPQSSAQGASVTQAHDRSNAAQP
jgi:hypothetical protein